MEKENGVCWSDREAIVSLAKKVHDRDICNEC